jgi:DNA-binding NarL/FixJ family response regulator
MAESYGTFSDVFRNITRRKFDMVIATNTSLPPARIQRIVPEIKTRYPRARIIVLSGYYSEDFVADLKKKGIDGFLPLPYEDDSLLQEVAGLLSTPAPRPE